MSKRIDDTNRLVYTVEKPPRCFSPRGDRGGGWGGNFSRKVLQIGYEPERDRLTWDGWDIHCGHGMDVLLPDRLDGGTWRTVSFEYNDEGWYMPGHPGVSGGPVGP